MIGDAAQYQELVTLYGSYGDDELLGLARGMVDLTEMAQALKGELTRRGLKIAVAREGVETRVLSDDDLFDMRTYAATAPDKCIFDFEDSGVSRRPTMRFEVRESRRSLFQQVPQSRRTARLKIADRGLW
jgi:hypothetical protein